ncbi:hypothetical protein V1477_014939 [Vespula maculifrons]|uniref:Uncharacterized protein n=1 Tax=Vespula maculifrons TaxID=7453 RepID=A0ABD2BIW4_VESMC
MLSHLGYFSQLAILLRSVLYFASPSASPTGLICSVAVKATVDEKSFKKSFHPCVGYENNALLAGFGAIFDWSKTKEYAYSASLLDPEYTWYILFSGKRLNCKNEVQECS